MGGTSRARVNRFNLILFNLKGRYPKQALVRGTVAKTEYFNVFHNFCMNPSGSCRFLKRPVFTLQV